MSKHLTRREMLRNTTLAGVAVWTARQGNTPAQEKSPNERLNIAVVGCGGRGYSDLRGVAGENIVALCDVDQRRAERAFREFPKAEKHEDFRRMLDRMHREIDAVVIGTPDHTHAPPGVMAMKLGKHCYCEKPLTHSVYECRVMTRLAVKNRLATQLGTQIHAGENYRRAVELVRSEAIGPVRECHVWFGGGIGDMDRPEQTPPVPPSLNWDLWLGPAPYRPYHPCYVPGAWRAWWDFANGTLGDFGCHYMDLPFWALKLRYPTSVEAEGPPVHPETTPRVLTVRYEFPAQGTLPPLKLTWYHGSNNRPALLQEKHVPEWPNGVLFVGAEGMLLADYSRRMLLPQSQYADFTPPEPTIPDSLGHHREWLVACKTGAATTCSFGYSGPLTEAVLLGNVSYRTGKRLQWDAENLKADGCPQADPYIRREYRQGWTL